MDITVQIAVRDFDVGDRVRREVAGQALAWLKISVLALAIVAVVWVMAKISVALHQRRDGSADDDPPV